MALFTKLPNWASILITVIAAIIVVGLVTWGGYELFKPAPPEETEGEGTEQQEEELPEDEFANWKTYRNEKMSFSIKYSPNWIIIATSPQDERYIGLDLKENEDEVCFDLGCKSPGITIEKQAGKTIVKFIENIQLPTQKLLKQEKITIADKEFTKLLVEQASGFQQHQLLHEKNDMLFVFSASVLDYNYLNMLEKILSTFKFIEADETADWEVYRNEEYGWEIKYPQDWETEIWEKTEGQYSMYDFQLKLRKMGDQEEYKKCIGKSCVFYFPDFKIQISPTAEKTIDDFIEKEKQAHLQGIGAYGKITEEMTVDGERALRLATCVEMASREGPVVLKNSYIYKFLMPYKCIPVSGPGEPEDSELVSFFEDLEKVYDPIHNQILSTFKFLD